MSSCTSPRRTIQRRGSWLTRSSATSRALVILGSRTRRHRTRREFEAYAPLVPFGSYLVVENTVLNDVSVDAGFGPGPHEALRRLMNLHGEFLADTTRERHALTCNQGGFRRIS
jgi:cephalosporin hydroxylase